MKKWISLFLAVALLAALACNASAETLGDESDELFELELPGVGMTLAVPAAFYSDNMYGMADVMTADELGYKSGVYHTVLGYIAMTDEVRIAVGFDEDYYAPIIEFICLKEGYDEDALYEADLDFDWNNAWCLGIVNDCWFYVAIGTDELPDGFTSPFIEEYYSFLDRTDDILEHSSFYEPQDPYEEWIGADASFITEDLYGNTIYSEDLFSANEVTMVNLWATWCGHCVDELPQLAKIHERLQSIGCGIIGVLDDSDDPDAVEEAKQLLAGAGVTYPVVKNTPEMEDIFYTIAMPTSFFVNRSGEIIGTPIQGALVDKYYEAVEDLLAGGATADIVTTSPGEIPETPAYDAPDFTFQSGAAASAQDTASALSSATEYRVICINEAGLPVAECMVQFCSDDTCMMQKTDENGIAAFQVPPGDYTVHLLKPPAGYAKDSTEYIAPGFYGDIIIRVAAA